MTTQATPTDPMNVLVVGLGVIGTTYGYLFQKAGHHVEHHEGLSQLARGRDPRWQA